jgi:hypothetical protein
MRFSLFATTLLLALLTLGLTANPASSITLSADQLAALLKAAIAAGVVGSGTAAAAAPGAAVASVASVASVAPVGVAAGATSIAAGGATQGSSIVCFTPYSAPLCVAIAAMFGWFLNPTVGAAFRSDQYLCCEGMSGSCELQRGYLGVDTCSRWSYTLYSLPKTYSHTVVNIPAKSLDGKTITFDVKGLNIVRSNWTPEAAEWFGQEYRKGSDLFKNAFNDFLPVCLQEYAITQTSDSLVQQGKEHTLSDPLLNCINVGLNTLRFPYKRDGSFRTTVSV